MVGMSDRKCCHCHARSWERKSSDGGVLLFACRYEGGEKTMLAMLAMHWILEYVYSVLVLTYSSIVTIHTHNWSPIYISTRLNDWWWQMDVQMKPYWSLGMIWQSMTSLRVCRGGSTYEFGGWVCTVGERAESSVAWIAQSHSAQLLWLLSQPWRHASGLWFQPSPFLPVLNLSVTLRCMKSCNCGNLYEWGRPLRSHCYFSTLPSMQILAAFSFMRKWRTWNVWSERWNYWFRQ